MNKEEFFYILENNFNIKESNIKNCYSVGSRISETTNQDSDYDYCVVLDQDVAEFSKAFFKNKKKYDISFYGIETYQNYLNKHRLYIVEHTYYPDNFFLKKEIDFKINLTKKELAYMILDHINSFYNEANFQKSLNKILIRAGYVEQILEYGKIVDFCHFNKDSEEIYSNSNFSELKDKYYTLLQSKINKFIKIYQE